IVHLKGGGRVEGRVIDRGDRVLVRFPSGEIEIPRERIERIEQKVSVLDLYEEKKKRLESGSAAAHYRLALWCRFHQLTDSSRMHLEEAIRIAPNHSGARAELGYEWVDGRWILDVEDKKAQGLVRYRGRWMSPEEVAALVVAERMEKRIREEARRKESPPEPRKLSPPESNPTRVLLRRSIRPTRVFLDTYFANSFPWTGSPQYGRIRHGTTYQGVPLGAKGFSGQAYPGPIYYGPYPYDRGSRQLLLGPMVHGPLHLYPTPSSSSSSPQGGFALQYRKGNPSGSNYFGVNLFGSSGSGAGGTSQSFGSGVFGGFQWKGGSLKFDTR
ncbi:MAG: hypothetical protein QF752_14360, partial [Planctomycetota bacterium]|nr:hypothetical protein [Planctomycetota bacterium]